MLTDAEYTSETTPSTTTISLNNVLIKHENRNVLSYTNAKSFRLQTISSSTTENRPTYLTASDAGFIHYDSTISRSIVWSGTSWIDSSAPATTSTFGTVKKAATQANSTATDIAGLVNDFNALLQKLKDAGIMS